MTDPRLWSGRRSCLAYSRATSPAGYGGRGRGASACPDGLCRRAKKSMLTSYERHGARNLPGSPRMVKTGSPAVPALIEAVEPPSGDGASSQSQRIHALRSLAEIRDHRAIPVMMQVMQEDSALLQHWAQEGLERLGLDMVYIKPQ